MEDKLEARKIIEETKREREIEKTKRQILQLEFDSSS
jgi:hypothetical protein